MAEKAFFNREAEIRTLERAWATPGPNLVMVWGRRRTGKTRLLGRFVEDKRAVFYGATEQAARAELRGFSAAVRQSFKPSGDDLLAHSDFPDWEVALRYLARRAARQRLVVVLDEFPYLVETEPALPSVIQRFWDREARASKLHLVLCGSAQALMEDLQAARAPLFGRIDARLNLRPFELEEAALFVPRLSPAERVICHAVVGGMPTYLTRWDDKVGHRGNIRRLYGDPASPLVAEGEFVLKSELRAAAGYFRILRAIASGRTTYGAIRHFADIEV
ncbi:MAG TPA: ATP-binding protein, partial [Vicinamibacteria bacterium]|nr:ATP-binding protein [Vicinamibacteria bacterium]